MEPKASPQLPSVVDLFAGCGGLSLGFQQAGFEVLAGFDGWAQAVAVYDRNLVHPGILLDLSDLAVALPALRPWVEKSGIIVGGPPCQDFSPAGKRVEAGRADLTHTFAQIVDHFLPRAFVMENVARSQRSRAYRRATMLLGTSGYGLSSVLLDASRCGVPQTRQRLFTIGVLGENDGFLDETLLAGLSEKPMTVREHFGTELTIDHYYRHPRSYARRGVFSLDEPSPTIRGVNRPLPAGYPGHPGDTSRDYSNLRALTTAERARIQTFPASFDFGPTKTAAEQMIGNAVPPNLAEYVARALAQHLEATLPLLGA